MGAGGENEGFQGNEDAGEICRFLCHGTLDMTLYVMRQG
jgi:hypothetical protein